MTRASASVRCRSTSGSGGRYGESVGINSCRLVNVQCSQAYILSVIRLAHAGSRRVVELCFEAEASQEDPAT